MVTIREIRPEDPSIISTAFAEQGWEKPTVLYETYLRECQSGERTMLVAEWEGNFAGYLTIVWKSTYPPFQEQNNPEIVDFNVLEKYQRRGIGTMLLNEAERQVGTRSELVGIGFGLLEGYGKAQILYIKRGYIPDGRGIFSHGRWLTYGDTATIGDDIALFLIKRVKFTETYTQQTEIIKQTLSTDHALNTLLALMRQGGQSALYLSGSRLDHAYGLVSGDVGFLFSVMPEDAEKAATPGYHPESAETYILFQGKLILEFLQEGLVMQKEIGLNDVHTFLPNQCYRVIPKAEQQAASLIVKTNLRSKPGVIRCEQCAYYPQNIDCPLNQRWKSEQS